MAVKLKNTSVSVKTEMNFLMGPNGTLVDSLEPA